ncbi:thioredoxin-like protein [Flagelloscypha sp. PMI_526]|nr:thioredoxin-like protein [Flagelloscypha sp. PMI_526]
MATPRAISIDIYDDLMCPNCFMAYTELGMAIKMAKEQRLPIIYNIQYHPLRLVCPEVLPDGKVVDRHDFLEARFGPEPFANFKKSVNSWGEKRGIAFAWHGQMGATTWAFRLSLKAFELGGKMAQYPLHGALFRASVIEGKDISDINLLADLASGLNIMSRDDAIAFLESDELKERVCHLAKANRAKGITSAPTIVINNKFKLEGAQCKDVYFQVRSQRILSYEAHSPVIFTQFLHKVATCNGGECSNAPSPIPPTAQLVGAV